MIFKLKTIKNYSFEWVLNDLELFIYKLLFINFFFKEKETLPKTNIGAWKELQVEGEIIINAKNLTSYRRNFSLQ